jgi:hypothetical protein
MYISGRCFAAAHFNYSLSVTALLGCAVKQFDFDYPSFLAVITYQRSAACGRLEKLQHIYKKVLATIWARPL